MIFDLNAIWAEIKAGEEGDVGAKLLETVKAFFDNMIAYLRDILEIA